MNGKVNAVTLGLANLFTKRQVEQATQGVVKSINGVTPDASGNIDPKYKALNTPFMNENGIINSHFAFAARFLVMGSAVISDSTAKEIHNAIGLYESCVIRLTVINPQTRINIPYTSIKAGTVYNDAGQIIGIKNTIYFGDSIQPIVINPVDNTITLDPDWVAPEPTATQSYVTQAIAPVQEDVGNLESGKVSLPVTNSTPNYGTAGQFAVSDGNGGITWKTLVEAEGVDY